MDAHLIRRRDARSVVIGIAVALLVAAFAAQAQAVEQISKQQGFNARAWTVTTPDADGIRYIGGDFTAFNAWQTGKTAVINVSDGQVDPSFPSASGWPEINDVAPDGLGGYYIAGGLDSVGGVSRSRVAHILSDGTVNPNFSATFNNRALTIEVVGSTVYVGGMFTQVNGQPRSRVAAFDTSGTLLSLDPNASSWVWGLEVIGDRLYIGGTFGSVAGQSRTRAAAVRLDARTGGATGTCLTNWDATDCLTGFAPSVPAWAVYDFEKYGSTIFVTGPGAADGGVIGYDEATGALDATFDFDLDGDSRTMELVGSTLYVGGYFTAAGGVTRNQAAAFDLSVTGATLDPWNPNVTQGGDPQQGWGIYDLDVEGSTVYLAGNFFRIGGEVRSRVGAVDATTGAVTSWDPHVSDWTNGVASTVWGLEVVGTKVVIAGNFDAVGGLKRLRVAAVGPDGILTDWAPAVDGSVSSFSRSGNTIYMTGRFGSVNGVARQWAAAVTTTGSVTAWNPNPGGDRPVAVIATPSKVYLGGFFDRMGPSGSPTFIRAIAAVDPTTGALDTGFDVGLDGHVRSMALSGNTLYFGGAFTRVGAFDTDPNTPGYEIPGTVRDSVAAVSATDGSVVAGWNAGALGAVHGRGIYVENVTMDVDGSRVFLGGSFNSVNGVTRNYAVALDAQTGAVDPQWAPPLQVGHNGNGDVYAIAPTADAIYLGGDAAMSLSSGGQTRQALGAVDPDTGAILPWSADTNEVRGLSASDAAVFVVGSFSWIGGAGRGNSAAIGVDGAMLDPWPMVASEVHPLQITMAGTSTGQVVSNPGGIKCGGACAYGFGDGSSVTLTAVPAAGADFDGWSGACTGSSTTCTVSMSAARSATATFVPAGTGGSGGGSGGSSGGSGGGSPSGGGSSSTDAGGGAAQESTTKGAAVGFALGRITSREGAIRVPVTVDGPGRIVITGTRSAPRFGRSSDRVAVCSVRVSFAKASTRVLVCVPNRSTRHLQADGPVGVRLQVRFVPEGGTASVKTRLFRLERDGSSAETVTG